MHTKENSVARLCLVHPVLGLWSQGDCSSSQHFPCKVPSGQSLRLELASYYLLGLPVGLNSQRNDRGWGVELRLLGECEYAASGHLGALECSTSTVQERLRVLHALHRFTPLILRQHALVRTDNTGVFFIQCSGRSGIP